MAEWKKIEDMPADFQGGVWIVTEELNDFPIVLLCDTFLNHRKE